MRAEKLPSILKVWIICTLCLLVIVMNADVGSAKNDYNALDQIIEQQMKKSKIPGMSVVVVKGDTVIYSKGIGHINDHSNKMVTSSTLFELGSTSKAFTSLAILTLAQNEQIDLKAPVSRYIPGFHAMYHGEKQEITIEQLIHHTSGIPLSSIARIKADSSEKALQHTVENINGIELDRKPGTAFQYATINYDVLGYIIQKISRQTYEEYITEQIFKPLNLSRTYAGRQDVYKDEFAEGFKLNFFKASAYEAPEYKGNTPAGYIIMNANDLAKWLQYQLNENNSIIKKSHEPDLKVRTEEYGVYYNYGWYIKKDKHHTQELFHGGSNPNYSSFFIIRPEENLAIGVLANMNSAYTELAARKVLHTVANEKANSNMTDPFQFIDALSVIVFTLCIFVNFIITYRAFVFIKEMHRGIRGWQVLNRRVVLSIAMWLFVLILGFLIPSLISQVFFKGLPWDLILIWGPYSLRYLSIGFYVMLIGVCVFRIIKSFTKLETKRGKVYEC